jgi:hypothetical protein
VEGSVRVEDFGSLDKKVGQALVFFQAGHDNFVAVYKDCTRHDISDNNYGWCQIGFHYHNDNMLEIDIGGERTVLAARANGSSWMPQVLPEVYNYPIKNPSRKFRGEYGGLCGRLSLLIGMAAFSGKEEHAEPIVSQCFQFEIGVGRKLIMFTYSYHSIYHPANMK